MSITRYSATWIALGVSHVRVFTNEARALDYAEQMRTFGHVVSVTVA